MFNIFTEHPCRLSQVRRTDTVSASAGELKHISGVSWPRKSRDSQLRKTSRHGHQRGARAPVDSPAFSTAIDDTVLQDGCRVGLPSAGTPT
jgi:hypothetical protein